MNTFTAPSHPKGLGWTFTTYALKYLDELEANYGPRTAVLPYGGVELIPHGRPHTWYPNSSHIVVRLNTSVLNSLPEAIFQLSHEIVHVLCDGGPYRQAINLEEGLATWFSKLATDRDSGNPHYASQAIAMDPRYQAAYTVVDQLLQQDSDAIKKLRSIQPVLGSVSSADFTTAGVNVAPSLISSLLAPF